MTVGWKVNLLKRWYDSFIFVLDDFLLGGSKFWNIERIVRTKSVTILKNKSNLITFHEIILHSLLLLNPTLEYRFLFFAFFLKKRLSFCACNLFEVDCLRTLAWWLVFTNGPGDLGSILGRVVPKAQKKW